MQVTMTKELRTPADWIEYWDGEVAAGRMTQAVATDKFSLFMQRGLNVVMGQAYKDTKVVYPLVTVERRSDAEEVTQYAGLGPVSGVKQIAEKEEIPEGEFNHDRTSIVNKKWAMALRFTAEMVRRDKSGKIPAQAAQIGVAHQNNKDSHYATSWFNTAHAIYDGGNWFADTHPDVTGGTALAANDNSLAGGAISVANIDAARQAVAGWRDWSGQPLNTGIESYVVAANQFENAVRFCASSAHPVVQFSSGVVNPHQGTRVIEWVRLTASTWYAQTGLPGLTHQIEVPFATTRENQQSGDAFWREIVLAVKGVETWGSGVTDWRSHLKGN